MIQSIINTTEYPVTIIKLASSFSHEMRVVCVEYCHIRELQLKYKCTVLNLNERILKNVHNYQHSNYHVEVQLTLKIVVASNSADMTVNGNVLML